jgi:hypothetical protein
MIGKYSLRQYHPQSGQGGQKRIDGGSYLKYWVMMAWLSLLNFQKLRRVFRKARFSVELLELLL